MPKYIQHFIIVALLIGGTVFFVFSPNMKTVDQFDYQRFPKRGYDNASVKITVIEDFRCKACVRTHEKLIPNIIENYINTKKATLYYASYPVVKNDSLSFSSEILSLSDRYSIDYWKVADLAYQLNSPDLSIEKLHDAFSEKFSVTINTPNSKYKETTERIVKENRDYLRDIGIRTIPVFIVNNIILESPRLERLIEVINSELKKQNT